VNNGQTVSLNRMSLLIKGHSVKTYQGKLISVKQNNCSEIWGLKRN
jgi:hypothetical protein